MPDVAAAALGAIQADGNASAATVIATGASTSHTMADVAAAALSALPTAGGTLTGKVQAKVHLAGNTANSAHSINTTAVGSGVNGPATAQLGLDVTIVKDNWWTGGAVGELDGIAITVRNNSATDWSDTGGILINVQSQGNGFIAATEYVATIVDPFSNTITHGMDIQEAGMNSASGDYIGHLISAIAGTLKTGLQIQALPAGTGWDYFIKFIQTTGPVFYVDGAGKMTAAGGADIYDHLMLDPKTPASSSATGVAGQISVDANYIYVCTATNSWKRAALTTW
jgi:hypothetical protein